jgi:hypothetical protein
LPLVVAGCASRIAYGPAAAVPLVHVSTDEGRWYVPVDTPQGPQVLFFDTGYARTTCDDALVDALDLPVRGHTRIRGEVGSTVARHTRLPAMRIGGHELADVRCQVRDLGSTSSITDPPEGPVAGVLGIDVLRRFVMEVDPAAATVTLSSPRERPPDATQRMRREGGVGPRVVLRVEVDGRTLHPVLDTGADQTWIRGRAAHLAVTQVQEDVLVRGTGASGGELRDLAYYHLDAIEIGGQMLRDLVVIDRSRPWWSDGLLGLDVLGQLHGVYDLSRRRFGVVPVSPAALPAWVPGQATPIAISP